MPYYQHSLKPIIELKDIEEQKFDNHYKPRGLWLSYNPIEWEIKLSDMGRYGTYYKYKVTFKKDINLCVIDSLESLEKFNKKYKDKKRSIKINLIIDWNKVARDYDGIKFINYEKLKKEFDDLWVYSVEFNSICIWRPSKVVSKMILEEEVIIDKDYEYDY